MLNNPPRTIDRALVIEVDTVLLHGISHSLKPLLALFKENGQELDQWQFIQRVVGTTPERLAEQFFGPGGKPGFTEAVRATVLTALQTNLGHLAADVATIVNEAAPKEVKVVLVSALPDVRIKELLGDELKDKVQVVQVIRSHFFVYKPEMWHAICARAGRYERLCAAVVGSGISCRSALAAGLHSLVAYDPLMEGNDFSGADYVSAKIDKKLLAEGFRRLRK